MNMDELHVGHFYRINGRILYCVRYTLYVNAPGTEFIHFEGIPPEDYAAYLTHCVIGDSKNVRTVAEIASIPYPEAVEIQFSSDAKMESLSKEEAMREWQEQRKEAETYKLHAKEIHYTAENALETGRTHPIEYQLEYAREALAEIMKLSAPNPTSEGERHGHTTDTSGTTTS